MQRTSEVIGRHADAESATLTVDDTTPDWHRTVRQFLRGSSRRWERVTLR